VVSRGNTVLEGLQNKQEIQKNRSMDAQIQNRIRSAEAAYFLNEDLAKASRKGAGSHPSAKNEAAETGKPAQKGNYLLKQETSVAHAVPEHAVQHQETPQEQSTETKARKQAAREIIEEKYSRLELNQGTTPELKASIQESKARLIAAMEDMEDQRARVPAPETPTLEDEEDKEEEVVYESLSILQWAQLIAACALLATLGSAASVLARRSDPEFHAGVRQNSPQAFKSLVAAGVLPAEARSGA